MSGPAVTFDFHNTLAACPEWFELEVRTLPSAFLRWWPAARGNAQPPGVSAEADSRYRQLRRDIIEHGNELTAEACLEAVFAEMQLAVPPEEIRAGVAKLMRAALAGASPIPGAVEAVREIHRASVPIGVVSSAVYHPFLEWTLAALGIRGALRVIVTSASAGFYKSRPEIFLHASQALGSDPEQSVHVGDSLKFDVGGAQSAGMGTVWLQRDGAEPFDRLPAPDLVIKTLEGAAPAILGLLSSRSPAMPNLRA